MSVHVSQVKRMDLENSSSSDTVWDSHLGSELANQSTVEENHTLSEVNQSEPEVNQSVPTPMDGVVQGTPREDQSTLNGSSSEHPLIAPVEPTAADQGDPNPLDVVDHEGEVDGYEAEDEGAPIAHLRRSARLMKKRNRV